VGFGFLYVFVSGVVVDCGIFMKKCPSCNGSGAGRADDVCCGLCGGDGQASAGTTRTRRKRMTTWHCVQKFSSRMEAKLAKNRHKGDRAGWLRLNPEILLKLLKGEVRELTQAIEKNHPKDAVVSECADVANFAMMISDWLSYKK
jgi:NTP pyrophosphatase (non-canonical NTP hydrolase)